MQSLQVSMPLEEQLFALREIYRTTRTVRLRSRAQMALLAIEQHLSIAQIAVIVRSDGATVQRWLKRWMDEGIDGLTNRRGVGAGAAAKLTRDYEELLLASVGLRPRVLGQEFSLWTLRRVAEYMDQQTGIPVSYESVRRVLKAGGIVLSRPQHTTTSPDPAYKVKKRRLKRREKSEKRGMRSIMQTSSISAGFPPFEPCGVPSDNKSCFPRQANKMGYYGIGAVNYFTGETVVQFRPHKRRKEMALLLRALLEKHSTGTICVTWDHANTHRDEDVQEVLDAAAGRIILLYLPTYSPWLNPIEMLWRYFRLQVTHGELFVTKQALLVAAQHFFDRYNQYPHELLSVIGSHSAVGA